MIPTSMFVVILFVSIMWAVVIGFFIGRAVERKRNKVTLNVFDAYSDALLERERKETAENVRKYHGSTYYASRFRQNLGYLAEINREIKRRKALSESNRSQVLRELEAFDLAFKSLEKESK